MPTGSIRFPVFSLASRGLLASYWKATPRLSTTVNARTSISPYSSSIADAMLGRAVKVDGANKPKPDLAKQLFPSSSPAQNGNIKEIFKNPRQASQSIGGYTGYTNSATALHTRSPNIKPVVQKPQSSISRSSTGLSSFLNKQDSFQNAPDTIDLTEADNEYNRKSAPATFAVEFDENDFDDDEDIDLDYELPMPMAAPPRPQAQKASHQPSPFALPQIERPLTRPNPSQDPTSSTQTWSSSPPSHRMAPPGARGRQTKEYIPEQSDPNPRPSKRRTLPWLEEQAILDEIASREGEEYIKSSSETKCLNCLKIGHSVRDCKETGTTYAYTPLLKDRKERLMPWDTTGSAIAEEKKRLKNIQKEKARKLEEFASEQTRKSKAKVAMSAITLSDEQKRVLDLVVNQQKSVFFTGSAGTGKSVLMRAIIAELKKKYVREGDRVAVTASTGLAACNIGGVTLHSFGGIGLGKEDVPTLVKKIKRNQKAKNRWIRTKILVIDEISMVDGDLFDKLEGIARAMRNNGRPFGGIQLVITGDFFQLPPVPDYDSKSRGVKFAFDAGTWSTAIHHTIGLTEVFRQKDPVFANMLNEMRLGKITDETVTAFRKLSRKIQYEDALDATELFPTRNEVENSNAFRMRDLKGTSYKYVAVDSGTITDLAMRDKLLANMMAPKQIELKKGAQVMLIKNMDDGLVNGSLGKVIAFMSEKTFEIYDNNPEVFDDSIPTTDLDEDGQATRSRVRAFTAPNTGTTAAAQEFPLVRFALADGTSRDLLVQPEEWKVELPTGEVQAQRSQLPLILAWALSIHKAQGQTLERVKIDLKKIFEKGQAYVALSRATSQAGLEVRNFDKSKVMAHPRVAQFYNSLYSVNKALEHPKVASALSQKSMARDSGYASSRTSQMRQLDFDEEQEIMAAYA